MTNNSLPGGRCITSCPTGSSIGFTAAVLADREARPNDHGVGAICAARNANVKHKTSPPALRAGSLRLFGLPLPVTPKNVGDLLGGAIDATRGRPANDGAGFLLAH
jgi:hypothetical protein